MTTKRENTQAQPLRRLLDLHDRLRDQREKSETLRPGASLARLRQQKSRTRSALCRVLANEPPAMLRDILMESKRPEPLTDDDRLLVSTLFHARLGGEEAVLSGRELLWILADSSFELLQAVRHLHPDSLLISSGLVVAEEAEDCPEDDLLDLLYRLAPAPWQLVVDRHAGPPSAASPPSTPRPFADNTDLFLALTDYVGLMERRAGKVFAYGLWRETLGESTESIIALESRIERRRDLIAARLALTPTANRFELMKFRREFDLSEAEMIIIVLLLAQETLYGSAILDTIDVLRVISASSRDLLRRRQLLTESSTLVQEGIVAFEPDPAGKTLGGQMFLSSWVTDRLVDACIRAMRDIAVDEKIEFHNYLSRLDGSDDFFEKL